jgi:hypothetical protein
MVPSMALGRRIRIVMMLLLLLLLLLLRLVLLLLLLLLVALADARRVPVTVVGDAASWVRCGGGGANPTNAGRTHAGGGGCSCRETSTTPSLLSEGGSGGHGAGSNQSRCRRAVCEVHGADVGVVSVGWGLWLALLLVMGAVVVVAPATAVGAVVLGGGGRVRDRTGGVESVRGMDVRREMLRIALAAVLVLLAVMLTMTIALFPRRRRGPCT